MSQAGVEKPDIDFIIRLVGPGIKPWVIPGRALARVIGAAQRLVDQEDEGANDIAGDEGKQSATGGGALRLMKVKSSSAGYAVAAGSPEPALKVLRETGKAISHPEKADWSNSTISSIEELSDVARSLGCEIEFRLPAEKGYGDVIAKITPYTYESVESSAFIRGPTSIFGKIERIGGATEMHCGVRIANQIRMVICRVATEDLVRSLGNYIYQEVMLSGQATWLRHNWHIKHFNITGFEPPKSGSIRETLNRVYEAGGNAWDAVDNPAEPAREGPRKSRPDRRL